MCSDVIALSTSSRQDYSEYSDCLYIYTRCVHYAIFMYKYIPDVVELRRVMADGVPDRLTSPRILGYVDVPFDPSINATSVLNTRRDSQSCRGDMVRPHHRFPKSSVRISTSISTLS